jgi:5-formyltetrahydrofolate cyclo-ligase
MATKADIRRHIAEFMQQSPAAFASDVPARTLLAALDEMNARTVLAFASMGGEVSTDVLLRGILDSGRTLVLPRATSKIAAMTLHRVTDLDIDLEKSRLGFPQPLKTLRLVDVSEIDLIVVPGVAFDETGNRLGRGAGHYDRMLALPGVRARIVGLAVEAQIVPAVPVEAHDRPMHAIYTERRVIRIAK